MIICRFSGRKRRGKRYNISIKSEGNEKLQQRTRMRGRHDDDDGLPMMIREKEGTKHETRVKGKQVEILRQNFRNYNDMYIEVNPLKWAEEEG